MKKRVMLFLFLGAVIFTLLMGSCGDYYVGRENVDNNMPNRETIPPPFPGAGRIDDVKLTGNGETVYEDAEDGSAARWWITPENPVAEVINVFDTDRQSRVIEFFDNNTDTSFILGNGVGPTLWDTAWRNTTQFTLEFSLRYRVDFTVTVLVNTTEIQPKFLLYTPDDFNLEYPLESFYAHHGLGSTASDGTWRTFSLDLNQDLKDQFPSLEIYEVLFVNINGKCPPPPVIEPSETPFSIGFWKNNIKKLIGNKNGTQIDSLQLLEDYLAMINVFELSVFDEPDLPDLDAAYAVLSSTSSDPVSLLKKQLLAAELNFMNGAYFSSPDYTQQQLLQAETLILSFQAGDETVTPDDLILMKNLLDSFNNGDLID